MEFLLIITLILNLASICTCLFIYLKQASAMDNFKKDYKQDFKILYEKIDSTVSLVKAKSSVDPEKWSNLKSAFSVGRTNERS